MRKETTESFIEKATRVHGNKFSYEHAQYVAAHDKIAIMCSMHGIFQQVPYAHLAGQGCRACANAALSPRFRKSREKFIDIASKIHNLKFDYSKVQYINNKANVIIVCPMHGEFSQSPKSHLLGNGCGKCSGNAKLELEDFITRSQKIHMNKYTYEKVIEYTGNKVKVTITCPRHGEFSQRPNSHLLGQGCLYCNESHGEKYITQYLMDAGLIFCRQYRIPNCRNKRPLPFDFAVFNDTKLIALIEYQGAQHYRHDAFNLSRNNFAGIQQRDKIKFDYCNMNNIPLLIIPYYDRNKITTLTTFLDML